MADLPAVVNVKKASYYAMTAVDDDGTPLHNGERMVEIEPGHWVTPLAAMARALFAEVSEQMDDHQH